MAPPLLHSPSRTSSARSRRLPSSHKLVWRPSTFQWQGFGTWPRCTWGQWWPGPTPARRWQPGQECVPSSLVQIQKLGCLLLQDYLTQGAPVFPGSSGLGTEVVHTCVRLYLVRFSQHLLCTVVKIGNPIFDTCTLNVQSCGVLLQHKKHGVFTKND